MSVSYVSPVTRAVAAGITLATMIWSATGSATLAQETRPSVGVADTERFGPILVDADGWALYTWVVDRPGESTCYGSCVDSWPPALVDGPVIPPAGLAGSLGTTQRTDGTVQLTYNDWPLYRYYRDTGAGEPTGDGSYSSGAIWPVAVTGAVMPTVMISAHDELGPILASGDGMTLYTWAGDQVGASACNDACTVSWPPLLVDDRLITGPGLSRVLGTITREDGTLQATFSNRPLYLYRRDTEPGEALGVGSNGFGAPWAVAAIQLVQ